ncbi:MAG: SMC-Scp complex subunit ScpB [Proteobacteria bacterium]|nr:SMC-Scp complex subunit ScpB [Pseudomonadota bacterium]
MSTSEAPQDIPVEETEEDTPQEAQEEAQEETQEETSEETPEVSIDPQHMRLMEAILFASGAPLSERALAYRLPEDIDLKAMLSALEAHYADRGVNLVRAGKSWAFRTAPDLAQQLNKEIDVPRKLSRAAIETLAIIAYHQPISRAEIEEVRGVGLSKGTLDVLLEAEWIKPRGRRQTPGRPMTWGTTDGFLDHFGIEDVRDLPGLEELKAAGLLDAGPAISVYSTAADPNAEDEDTEDTDEEQGVLLALVDNGDDGDDGDGIEDDEPDPGEDEAEDDSETSEPLDPDDGGVLPT